MTAPVPSVDQLKELVLPPAVSYWPQTWGWALLAALLLAGLVLWAALRLRRWQRDRYRRQALARLRQLEQAMADQTRRVQALREVPELLKRVALSMPEAPAVAPLHAADWQAFLVSHSSTPLPADFAWQLAQLAYAPDSRLHEIDASALLGYSRAWVEHHHVAA